MEPFLVARSARTSRAGVRPDWDATGISFKDTGRASFIYMSSGLLMRSSERFDSSAGRRAGHRAFG